MQKKTSGKKQLKNSSLHKISVNLEINNKSFAYVECSSDAFSYGSLFKAIIEYSVGIRFHIGCPYTVSSYP